MPFEKVETQSVDFPALERQILEFWDRTNAFEKLRAKNRGEKRWSFLDGPITANNPMGVHHAWGRTYKDAYQRYFAMTGHDERYQNGFDCQGLWVEVEVEKQLGLESKRDIENLVPGDRFASIDKFVRLCKERVDKFARIQTEQSIRLGMWMDWDRGDADWAKPPDERKSYFTMSEENNYTIWGFLKKCHERGLVYRGFDSMPWCPRCGVGLSQMEMHEGYKFVAHKSVFVKFALRTSGEPGALATGGSQTPVANAPGSPREYLLVWTTTPWTLSSNVAAAVNPELTYLKVKHRDEIYYIAKGAFTAKRKEDEFKRKEWLEGVPKLKPIDQVFKEKGGFEIVGEIRGADMVGWTYDGPFDELPGQQHAAGYPEELAEVVLRQKWAPAVTGRDAHRVIVWADVGETEGTGIVHIAPGCGAEDFTLGKEQGIPPIAPLDEYGCFLPGFGELTGKSAVDLQTADWILFNLQQKNLLFASEKYPHSYPHCWRCKTELLFRLVDEWFIDMQWRDEIKAAVEQATFLPESINGKARELDWLSNMGDWMISKKRFWGLALPIWVCDQCSAFDVIGSRDELKNRAISGWDKLEGKPPHRPWVDLVKVRCTKCGGIASRIGDVGNPWLDAGIVPYSTMGYRTNRAEWDKWFPADFITESFPGQFRNWFYAILAMSAMMEGKSPFKTLLGHGLVRDQFGKPMHKSDGNAIAFDEAANTGYELFHDVPPETKAEVAMRDLPKGHLGVREELTTTREKTPVKRVYAKYKSIGADVIRWLYCRTQPAQNINFGPEPTDELRSVFHLKLWNVYAFFCNYARLDGFDPAKPQAAVSDLQDIDRWILSDLQLLIRTAREAFESYDVARFCIETERFVDEKLSNWYVRRNRRRFWKGEKGTDKDAAYQTLYTVLTTLTKLCAPVIPFYSELMWQNLRTPSDHESVHLCEYPVLDQSLIDTQLSAHTEALLSLVTLGSAARNAAKIKVRQPLSEIVFQSTNVTKQLALQRFAQQLLDELNVKSVVLKFKPGLAEAIMWQAVPNKKSLGSKFGPLLPEVVESLSKVRLKSLAFATQREIPIVLQLTSGPVTLGLDDYSWRLVAAGVGSDWVGVFDIDTQAYLNTHVTESLRQEGMAREVVRHVQDLRKKAGLEMEDRIELCLTTTSAMLQQAIDAHRDYIAAETLTVEWPNAMAGAIVEVLIDEISLQIALRKV